MSSFARLIAPTGADGAYERVEHEGHYAVHHHDVMVRGLARAFCLSHPGWSCVPCDLAEPNTLESAAHEQLFGETPRGPTASAVAASLSDDVLPADAPLEPDAPSEPERPVTTTTPDRPTSSGKGKRRTPDT